MCIICEKKYDVNMTELDCSGCVSICYIPELPNLKNLWCSYCPRLTHIPELPNLTRLDCSKCPRLTHIPVLFNLTHLDCYNCPRLTHIPELPKLKYLWCHSCPMLTRIPESLNLTVLWCFNSPWLPLQNLDYNTNIQKLKLIQSFCKRNFRYFLFKHWIKSKDFIEFFYSPEQLGGRLEKRQTERILATILTS